MRLRDQRVEVAAAGFIFRQYDNVVVGQVADALLRDEAALVDVRVGLHLLLLHHIEEGRPDFCERLGPRLRSSGVRTGDLESLDQLVERAAAHLRREVADAARDVHKCVIRGVEGEFKALCIFGNEPRHKRCVKRDERCVPCKCKEALQHLSKLLPAGCHLVGDARLPRERKGKRLFRVDDGAEGFGRKSLFDLHGGQLDEIVPDRGCSGRDRLDDDRILPDAPRIGTLDDVLHVVHEVALAAVDHLEIRILLVGGVVGLRERLHDPVVGDRKGLHAPALCLLDDVLRGGDRVHVGHLGVAVKLHALDRGVVHAAFLEAPDLLDRIDGLDHEFLLEGIERHHAPDQEAGPVFEDLHVLVQLLRQHPELHPDTVRVVGDGNVHDDLAAPDLPGLDGENLALHDDLVGILPQRLDRDRLALEAFAQNDIRVIGNEALLLPVGLLGGIGELLLLFIFLGGLLPAALVLLYDLADPVGDLLVLVGEGLSFLPSGIGRHEVNIRKARPLREDLVQVVDDVSLTVPGDHRIRKLHADLAVLAEIELYMQEGLVQQRAYLLELQEHGGPVQPVEVLRVVLVGQAEVLDDLHLHPGIVEYLRCDGVLDLIYIFFFDPVIRCYVNPHAVFRLVHRDP